MKWFAAVAAAMAPLPESLMYELVQDERVARRVEKLERVCLDELNLLYTVRRSTWQRLAYICQSTLYTEALRRDCIDAAQVALAFVTYRIFSEARSMPWLLCYGNVDKNLEDLKADEVEPEDLTARKIQQLLKWDDEQGPPILILLPSLPHFTFQHSHPNTKRD